MKPILEVQGLSKSFWGLQAIRKVDFSLHKGEVVGLIGPNGAGKTTLFNLISGFYKPDKGRFIFEEEDLTGCESHIICKKGITRTFQLVRPFSHLTVFENVVSGCLNREKRVKNAERKALAVLDLVDLADKKRYFPQHLTISDRKRLELAKALATEPSLLLLDEVMAGLNPKEQEDIIQLIHKIKELGVTLFIIEHAMKIIMALSDRVIVLNYGEKIAEGGPEEVSANEQVIEAYLGKGIDKENIRCRFQSQRKNIKPEMAFNVSIGKTNHILLKVDKVNVCYGALQVLYDFSLEITKGEIAVLIGANGAGKSTVSRCLTGLLPPRSGSIMFMGERIDKLLPHQIVERGLVQVPEGRKIFPNLTVKENLELGAYIREAKGKRSESMERVLKLFPVLETRFSQKAGTMSGGEQQMLAIGQGLMSRPKLIIFDEPSLGLAPLLVEAIFQAMIDINAGGTTILLSEQNTFYSLALCDSGYVLEDGRIVLSGDGPSLIQNEHVKKAYLGV